MGLLAMAEPTFTALLQAISTSTLITSLGMAFFYAWAMCYKLQQHASYQRRQ
jgi:anaerobic C4-dicarboxylate transporter